MRKWLAGAGALIAALAVLAGNLDKVFAFTAKWIAPYVADAISPRATLTITIDPALDLAASVFAAESSDETRAQAVAPAAKGQPATLVLPASRFYTIGWQGSGLEAGTVQKVLAVEGPMAFTLSRTGTVEDRARLALRQTSATGATPAAALPAAAPSAALLLSARTVQAAADPTQPLGPGVLPELDRATSIVGLFETGTTDCARRVFFVPAPPREGRVPAIGCLAVSLPGWLAPILAALDDGEARRLDQSLGEDAEILRSLARDRTAPIEQEALARATRRLVALPEFWVAYQAQVLAEYARAARLAREAGLASEQARLLLFDRIANIGPGAVARVLRSFAERHPPGAPTPQTERLRALGQLFKDQARLPVVQRRIDAIVTGQGTVAGIAFDLAKLGVASAD